MSYFPYYVRFSNGAEFRYARLTTGDQLEVIIWGTKIKLNCRFVKVTRKGFNIIDLDTNRAILKKHLYGSKTRDKEYPPKGSITIECCIPSWLMFRVTKSGKEPPINFENSIASIDLQD